MCEFLVSSPTTFCSLVRGRHERHTDQNISGLRTTFEAVDLETAGLEIKTQS